MSLESRRKTRFPGSDSRTLEVSEIDSKRRQTYFPGGQGLRPLATITRSSIANKLELPVRLPISVNQSDAKASRPTPQMKIAKKVQPSLSLREENPWEFYIALHPLERGGGVTAACTRHVPVKMVAMKKISSDHYDKHSSCRHENLLSFIEVFKHEGNLLAVTDYTTATLKQVIAVPLKLEEIHAHGGILYLFQHGLKHVSLDSSKVLFASDGCVKLSHFEQCAISEISSARSLGIIAIEMMQNGIAPGPEERLSLKSPAIWTSQALEFIDLTSNATLGKVGEAPFLKYISPSVMIPFVEYARWETVESHGALQKKST